MPPHLTNEEEIMNECSTPPVDGGARMPPNNMTNANKEEIMNECSTPVGAGAQQNEDKRELFTPELLEYYSHMSMGSSADVPPPKSFRVGILTINLNTVGRTVNAIANPASPCVVSALATLDPVDPEAVREWVRFTQCWT